MKSLTLLLLTSAIVSFAGAQEPKSLSDFQAAAAKANSVLTIPEWPKTPAEVEETIKKAIAEADADLTTIGSQDIAKVTFESTVRALDDIGHEANMAAALAAVIKETNQDPAMRLAAENAYKVYNEWNVGTDYREDVYKAVKAFADKHPKLGEEDTKLLNETMRSYKRAGLHLPPEKRQEVEKLRKELTKLETDFQANITQTKETLTFTRADLEGVPESVLKTPGVQQGDDSFGIQINVTFQYQTVMETAKKEETRKRIHIARFNLAREKNIPLFNQILGLRNQIALRLGYKSWADFQTEVKMAKNGAEALRFVSDLTTAITPKFQSEIAEMRKMKVAQTGDTKAEIKRWDWRYFMNELRKQKYTIDKEALRVYFPYQPTLEGMFKIYQDIFGLKFHAITPPSKWVDDLQLYLVADAANGQPLGLFYLDMFPREGKFNHFAMFEIIGGKALPNGKYQRPTVGLLCNFPPPAEGKPSLLTHQDVETLFHEFGHVMHGILTNARHYRFAGTNVPRDFVEAPSQMLQNWVWTKDVLDLFAADYRDPSKKIPAETVARLKEAKIATAGVTYRRQLSLGNLDLALHDVHPEGQPYDAVKVSNDIINKVFLEIDPETAFIAYFGHLVGYDAGYYGYAWADAIAADLATVFENSKAGFLDRQAGMKLRREIYEPGDSRDVELSVQKFLGRKRSIQPFLKTLGIGDEKKAKGGPSQESS